MKAIHTRFANEEEERLFDAIKGTAKSNRRSMNAEILHAIDFYLQHADEAKPTKEVKKKPSPK